MWPFMTGNEEMGQSDPSNEGLYSSDPSVSMNVPMNPYMQMNMGGYPPPNLVPMQMTAPMHPSGSPMIGPTNTNASIGLPIPSILSPTRKDELRRQIEYYFSVGNLARDTYLRGLMNSRGYVVLENLLTFPRIQQLSQNVDELTAAARASTSLKVKNRSVRLRSEWQTWVYPKPTNDDDSSEEDASKEDESSTYGSQPNEMLPGSLPPSMNPYPYYIYPQYIPYNYQNNMMGMGVNMLHDQPYMISHPQQSYPSQSAPMDGKKYSQQRKRQPMNHRNPIHPHNPHTVTSPQFSHRRDPNSSNIVTSPSTSSTQQSAPTNSMPNEQSSSSASSPQSSPPTESQEQSQTSVPPTDI
jgi:hypothetical protein